MQEHPEKSLQESKENTKKIHERISGEINKEVLRGISEERQEEIPEK